MKYSSHVMQVRTICNTINNFQLSVRTILQGLMECHMQNQKSCLPPPISGSVAEEQLMYILYIHILVYDHE